MDVPPWYQPVCRQGLASLQSYPYGQWCTWSIVKAAMHMYIWTCIITPMSRPSKATSIKDVHTLVSNLLVFKRLGDASSFLPSLVHDASTSSEGRIDLKVDGKHSSWPGYAWYWHNWHTKASVVSTVGIPQLESGSLIVSYKMDPITQTRLRCCYEVTCMYVMYGYSEHMQWCMCDSLKWTTWKVLKGWVSAAGQTPQGGATGNCFTQQVHIISQWHRQIHHPALHTHCQNVEVFFLAGQVPFYGRRFLWEDDIDLTNSFFLLLSRWPNQVNQMYKSDYSWRYIV